MASDDRQRAAFVCDEHCDTRVTVDAAPDALLCAPTCPACGLRMTEAPELAPRAQAMVDVIKAMGFTEGGADGDAS